MTMLEELARAIDPCAFRSWKSMVDYCTERGDCQKDAILYADNAYGPSVEKARATAAAILPILARRDAEAWNRAVEAAVGACKEQEKEFLSEGYAVDQPLSSFKERFACQECASAIASLKDQNNA